MTARNVSPLLAVYFTCSKSGMIQVGRFLLQKSSSENGPLKAPQNSPASARPGASAHPTRACVPPEPRSDATLVAMVSSLYAAPGVAHRDGDVSFHGTALLLRES